MADGGMKHTPPGAQVSGQTQQFAVDGGRVLWRTDAEGIPPARLFISSPHDIDARYGKKSTTTWLGYKGPPDRDVATTSAPAADGDVTPAVPKISASPTCCRASTSSTRPMSTPNCEWTAAGSTGWT